MAFHPPAIQNAQTRHSVQRRFHSAGAAGFQRKLRRIQPQVHAGGNFSAHFHVVVVQKYDLHGSFQRFFCAENFPDQFFSAAIIGMRFTGKYNLKFPDVLGNFAQTVQIGQESSRRVCIQSRGAQIQW